MRSVIVRDQAFNPLRGVDVELFNPDNGQLLQVARSNQAGLVTFNVTGRVTFRPRITRKSGKLGANSLPMTGATNLYPLPLYVPPAPLPIVPPVVPEVIEKKKVPATPTTQFVAVSWFTDTSSVGILDATGTWLLDIQQPADFQSFGLNVIAASNSLGQYVLIEGTDTSSNQRLAKVQFDGTVTWEITLTSAPTPAGDQTVNSYAVIEDQLGNIYISGSATYFVGSDVLATDVIQKYDADGNFVTQATYDDPNATGGGLAARDIMHIMNGGTKFYVLRLASSSDATQSGTLREVDSSLADIWVSSSISDLDGYFSSDNSYLYAVLQPFGDSFGDISKFSNTDGSDIGVTGLTMSSIFNYDTQGGDIYTIESVDANNRIRKYSVSDTSTIIWSTADNGANSMQVRVGSYPTV